jgi:hypothetical protein
MHFYEWLPPAGPEGSLGLVFPERFAFAVHFPHFVDLVAGNEKVAVGQAGHHGYGLNVQLQDLLTIGVIFGDAVAAVGAHDDSAVGHHVQPGVAQAGVEGFDLLAGSIQTDTPAVLAHDNEVTFARLVGPSELAQVVG